MQPQQQPEVKITAKEEVGYGWISYIHIDGAQKRSCGYFATETDAMIDGNEAAKFWLHFGSFDYLGLDDEEED